MTSSVECQWMGEWARQTLELKDGKVLGVTSKGIYLLFGQKTAFITDADEKSPFVIHVEQSAVCGRISPGHNVFASESEIFFPDVSIQIDLRTMESWTLPSSRPPTTAMPERMKRIGALLNELKKTTPNFQVLTNRGEMFSYAREFQTSFQNENLESCIAAAGKLLGLGSGLTPSGDDLLAGFLLYHNRLNQASMIEQQFVTALGKALTETAYEKTTFISANRIEAACRGWAEGIFLDVIDYLVNKSLGIPERAVERVLGFGHSSGVETLQGIALATSLN